MFFEFSDPTQFSYFLGTFLENRMPVNLSRDYWSLLPAQSVDQVSMVNIVF